MGASPNASTVVSVSPILIVGGGDGGSTGPFGLSVLWQAASGNAIAVTNAKLTQGLTIFL